MTLQYFEDLICQLCCAHIELRHGAGNRAFIPFESEGPATNHTDLAPKYVRVTGFTFNGQAENQWYYQCTLVFVMQPSATGMANEEEAIVACRRHTQSIVEDFEARLRMGDEEGICLPIDGLQDTEVVPVDATEDKAYGWEVTFTIADKKIEMNKAVWADL